MTQGCQGGRFPSATWVAEYDSTLLFKERGKIEPKEIPSYLIPYLLVVLGNLKSLVKHRWLFWEKQWPGTESTGKPVEGNQEEMGRGKTQLQLTTTVTHIRWYKNTASTGEQCLWHLTLFSAYLVTCHIYIVCMKSNVGYYSSTYPHNDLENFIPSRKKLVLERI